MRRVFTQGFFFGTVWLMMMGTVLPVRPGKEFDSAPIFSNTIHRFHHRTADEERNKLGQEVRPLKKVFLTNRTITCNDGSQAGFYLRKSHSSKKWIIFLEGGWYCYDHHSCINRWLRQRNFMTSLHWPETRDVGGILSPRMEDNPFWFTANHIFVPYCSSDSWSGTKKSTVSERFSFMGSMIVQQVIKDLLSLGLENGTDLLLTGSSAGGTGVMLNLDPVKKLLHSELGLKKIRIKGVSDSGWFLDRTPYAPTLKPAVDNIRKGMELWEGHVPEGCGRIYPGEPWRCYFGYRLYPTLQSQLFVFQWLFDEAQMDADNVGAPVTKQQWDYIHKMGDSLRQSFENVSAVFAPSCISHSVLTKHDWLNVRIDDVSIAEALHCWEQKIGRRNRRKVKQRRRQRNNNSLEARSGNRTEIKRRKKKRVKIGNSSDFFFASTSTVKPFKKRRRQQNMRRKKCIHRRLERCSWPQCNHSCPRLHNPFTGDEMDIIELLKSFGLDMESVAKALGIDMQTLNNMDHAELLNVLTQQAN